MDNAFRLAMLKQIGRFKKAFRNHDVRCIKAKTEFGYKNALDWHYGNFVGIMTGMAITGFKAYKGRDMTSEEQKELNLFILDHIKV